MTKHIDRAKILGHLGPDEIYENYKMGIPAAVVTRQQLREAIRAGEFDIEPEPIGNTEQFADILDAEQVDSIWRKADSSRGDEAYMRHDVFDLVNSHNNLLAEVERLQRQISDHGPGGRNYTNAEYVAMQTANVALQGDAERWEKAYDNADRSYLKQEKIAGDLRRELKEARNLLSLYGGKGDTDAALE